MSTRTWENLQIPTPGTFTLDAAHTRIGFVVKHMMVSKVRGHFEKFSGSVTIAENPLESSAELTIQTESINTGVADRDGHLRSDDFLSAEKYPELTFRSTRVVSHSGDTFTVLGDLTVRDITKPVEITVEYGGAGTNPWGQELWGFSISAEIDREEFGLTWNQALETGGVLVGKKIKIEIEGEANRA
ncbi:polyisoprenoid-binding protein YceI [Streptosporangium becharense]|uniref:Polyisoprenoid-binding protein YceI n=1 Tax=Streptosporangium becharense TaxID=1816182 RepID=A0A7W9IGC6_9ACTN|nr:YceI family protein [Streptosporangium becharense]MBB2914925.1 polyisoprenoid-binding protein YceI [Streptosporangium becharense]MBB5820264.1 polyisoprenoid-binding protein YceI [Streptosporangium becharense]